jgi:HEAT repeat protein
MNPPSCEELDVEIRRLALGPGLGSLKPRLDEIPDVEECIAGGLLRAAEAEDWPTFERYVLAAHQRPSRSYTSVLCRVLSEQPDDVNMEDIVDTIAEIGDPSAIGCLEDALWWQPPWDEYRGLAVKSVWALGAIGTPEAFEVLRGAASSGPENVREAAAHELERVGE